MKNTDLISFEVAMSILDINEEDLAAMLLTVGITMGIADPVWTNDLNYTAEVTITYGNHSESSLHLTPRGVAFLLNKLYTKK